MISGLAKQAEQALFEATQRLTPEERLQAFVMHSQLMAELYRAGEEYRRNTFSSAKPG